MCRGLSRRFRLIWWSIIPYSSTPPVVPLRSKPMWPASSNVTASAINFSSGVKALLKNCVCCRPASESAIRSIWNTSRRALPRTEDRGQRTEVGNPKSAIGNRQLFSLILWLEPTAIRRRLTAWACSAGASAASRPKRPCSVSRFRF